MSTAVVVGLIGLCLVALRAVGLITASWWLVTSPFWLPGCVLGGGMFVAFAGHWLAATFARLVSGR